MTGGIVLQASQVMAQVLGARLVFWEYLVFSMAYE